MSGGGQDVRDASERDAEACAAIYAPYVTDTAVTFESDPPLPAEMAQRIATAMRTHAWVVLETQGRVVGYAPRHGFEPVGTYGASLCPEHEREAHVGILLDVVLHG